MAGLSGFGGSGKAEAGVPETIANAPPITAAIVDCFAFIGSAPGVGIVVSESGFGGFGRSNAVGVAGGSGFALALGTAAIALGITGIGKTNFSVGGIGPSTGLGREAEVSGGARIGSGEAGRSAAAPGPPGLTLFPALPGRKLKSGEAGGSGLSASADFAGCAGGAISGSVGMLGIAGSGLGAGNAAGGFAGSSTAGGTDGIAGFVSEALNSGEITLLEGFANGGGGVDAVGGRTEGSTGAGSELGTVVVAFACVTGAEVVAGSDGVAERVQTAFSTFGIGWALTMPNQLPTAAPQTMSAAAARRHVRSFIALSRKKPLAASHGRSRRRPICRA